jgi:hypothetical protein
MSNKAHGPLVLLIGVALVCGAAITLYATGIIGNSRVSAEALDRVLLVAASEDDSGSVVAQVIAIADVRGAEAALEPVSPELHVTIPGTSYSTLADAYPFGGGAGVAEALARAGGEKPLPYVAIGPEALAEAVAAAGGVEITLQAPMNVFDGETLYTFKAGEQTLSAEQLEAVIKGAAYRDTRLREKLDAELADALLQALRARPETIDSADTNLDESAIAKVKAAL